MYQAAQIVKGYCKKTLAVAESRKYNPEYVKALKELVAAIDKVCKFW